MSAPSLEAIQLFEMRADAASLAENNDELSEIHKELMEMECDENLKARVDELKGLILAKLPRPARSPLRRQNAFAGEQAFNSHFGLN